MTQNKYTNWNVVAVVVHVYKENKKICENWSQNFDDEDDFFFTVHKNPEWYFDLDFLKEKKNKICFCFDDFTRQLDVELLREGQVEVAEVHLEQMLVLQHPQHNFLIFLQRVR